MGHMKSSDDHSIGFSRCAHLEKLRHFTSFMPINRKGLLHGVLLKVDFKLHPRDQQTVDLLINGNDPPLLKTGFIYKFPFNCLRCASECLG